MRTRIAIIALEGQLLEFRPSPVFLLVSAAVSLTTPLEPTAGTAMSVVLMTFRWGQAGAGLPYEMQLDQQSLPQAGSIHHHHWCVQFLLPRLNFCSACPYPPFCPPLWISAGLPRSQREPGTVCNPMSCLLSEVDWSVKVVFQSGYLDQATWV